ncbi:MAG: beta-ketoacyl-[acyl-carrier-protein] synthase family protein [Planctomycetota bacterium]|nr:beta-ketoacyl-[acyl-carrier-protein] synthase family protein [Planctomycetota bacterium]
MSERPVVITGIGLVTPAGPDRESSWAGIRGGRSFTRWLTPTPGVLGSTAWVGAPTDWGNPPVSGDLLDGNRLAGEIAEPLIELALRAATEAVADARLIIDASTRDRIGSVVGTSKGGWHAFQHAWEATYRGREFSSGGSKTDPFALFLPDTPARRVAARLDLRGPCLCPVAACATGLISIARGADLIAQGRCDAVLAGSVDASLVEIVQGSFRRLGVLARPGEDGSRACRPFDRDRDGFVVGEGGAVLVLESADRARARGAKIYATWLAAGVASEATHLARLNEDPTDLARLITRTLQIADVATSEIDYVNYHGTGTRPNDRLETAAIRRSLGPVASQIPGSSLKGSIGHLLGGAGSVELATTLLAMRDGIVPPTVNLEHPDAECDLDYTPRIAHPARIETALKLSLGFGGHLACAVLRRGDISRVVT